MQPYLFPYLGYLQLLAASDVFVVRNDVAYVEQGWMNRNRILVNGRPHWVTLPVARDSHTLPISARKYVFDKKNPMRALRSLETNYRRAPQFSAVYPLLELILLYEDSSVAGFNTHAITQIASFMEIQTPIVLATDLHQNPELRGQSKVLDICREIGAKIYVNPIGGTTLYNPDAFAAHNIELRFLRSTFREYPQGSSTFVPSLSIIDVLMFNRIVTVREMLKDRELIPHPDAGT